MLQNLERNETSFRSEIFIQDTTPILNGTTIFKIQKMVKQAVRLACFLIVAQMGVVLASLAEAEWSKIEDPASLPQPPPDYGF